MTTKQKEIVIGVGIVLFVIAWSVLLYFYDAKTIVDFIGAENGYLVMFLVALFGGVSSLGGVSYLATLVTLASGGLDPVFLALASGAGVSIGDTVYFYLGKKGLRTLFIEKQKGHIKIRTWVGKVTDWLDNKPSYITYMGTYILIAFTPTPNDLLTISLGVANRKYVPIITALVLGNMTHTYLIALFGREVFFL